MSDQQIRDQLADRLRGLRALIQSGRIPSLTRFFEQVVPRDTEVAHICQTLGEEIHGLGWGQLFRCHPQDPGDPPPLQENDLWWSNDRMDAGKLLEKFEVRHVRQLS